MMKPSAKHFSWILPGVVLLVATSCGPTHVVKPAGSLEQRAVQHYQQDCDAGDMQSCNNLGEFYEDGVGVAQDKARAATLFRRACAGGIYLACGNLRHLEGPATVKTTPRALQVDSARAEGERVIAELLKAKPFIVHKTPRIHLYYYRGSEAEKDRELIVSKREAALDRLEQFFGKKAPGPIRVLLFPSAADASPYRPGGTMPASWTYYAVYSKGYWSYEKHNPSHELTHLFSNTDESSRMVYLIGLLDEGLAEYFSGNDLDAHTRCTQYMQIAGTSQFNMRLDSRFIDYGASGVHYLGGSLVQFLLDTQPGGRAKFLRLLKETRFSGPGKKADLARLQVALARVYGKPYDALLVEWNKALEPYWSKTIPVRPEDRRALESLVRKSKLGKIERILFHGFPQFLELSLWLSKQRWARVVTDAEDHWSVTEGPGPRSPRQ